ncbi:putative porin [Marinibactrum halimedae]|uniref:Membrane protein n=1 Tax=Marinibactrum halimedae TaxID=1444977 RepID=A0AA37T9H2_9GAMM|nr:putative porin [Marinibactrum halimedae]MCD9460178.1 putative porin [Marinibactrum halimedae]GLS26351.1 membrane protein [Marinibactrum halimedae]
MKKVIFSAVLMATASMAFAEDYMFEIGAGFGELSGETDLLGFDGTFYFDGVEVKDGPYAEAAFLDQASYISGAYLNLEDYRDETDAFGIGGRFVSSSGWIVEGERIHLETKRNRSNNERESTTYEFGLGRYINDNISIVGNYSRTMFDNDLGRDPDDISTIGADFKIVQSFGNGMAFTAEAGGSVADDDNDTVTFDVLGKVYLNQQLGLGATIEQEIFEDPEDDDEFEDLTYFGLVADYFITPSIFVTAEVGQYDVDNADTEWTVSGNVRF